jgi:hypothetical protein
VIVLVAPAGRLGTVRVAVPFTMVTGVPSCVPLLKNVTVPVGVTGIPESVAKAPTGLRAARESLTLGLRLR